MSLRRFLESTTKLTMGHQAVGAFFPTVRRNICILTKREQPVEKEDSFHDEELETEPCVVLEPFGCLIEEDVRKPYWNRSNMQRKPVTEDISQS